MIVRRWTVVQLVLVALVALGVGATQVEPSASFRVVTSSGTETLTLGADGGTVLCTRDAGFADLWIRLSAGVGTAAASAPHLDLDICGLGSADPHRAMDARGARCGDAPSWAAWWHGADGEVFTNTPEAADCTLQLTLDGDALSGTFRCRGMRSTEGAGEVAVTDGSLRCTID